MPGGNGEIIKKLFAEIAKGKSAAEVREQLGKKRCPYYPSTFSLIVRNHVYIGEIYVQHEKSGYTVKRLHKPLIDQAIFNQVQVHLQGNYKVKQLAKPKAFKEELHLRSLLLSSHCDQNLTGSASKGRNGARHHYYHCNHCGKDRIRAKKTHQRIEALLGELKVSSEATKLYEKMVRKLLSGQEKSRRPVAKIDEEIQQYEQRIKNMEDDLADRLIDIETFSKSKARFTTELSKLKSELSDQRTTTTAFDQFLKKGIHLLKDIPSFYSKSSVQVKREVIGSIFPEKLVVIEKNVEPPKSMKPFCS